MQFLQFSADLSSLGGGIIDLLKPEMKNILKTATENLDNMGPLTCQCELLVAAPLQDSLGQMHRRQIKMNVPKLPPANSQEI